MTLRGLGAALVMIAVVLAPLSARAQGNLRPVTYRVKPGDTLELIAAEFYGDRGKAVFILDENKLARPRPLRPGERLRIPVSHEITTSPNDTLESLALAYLGSGLRSSFLADWNNLSQDDSLPAGLPLIIPFTVLHVAPAPEVLTEVSRAYFGDSKQAEMLRRYNQLDRTSLEKGEQLIVPAYHIRLSPAKQPAPDPDARARRERRRSAMARATRAVPAARQSWRDGDFAAVKATLLPSDVELDFLDADVAADIAVLLGAAYLAFNDGERALTCFQRAYDRQRQRVLRRYDYSPKIIALWEKVGGTVE